MSTEETVRLTVEMILSTREGEMQVDQYLENIMLEGLGPFLANQDLDLLALSITDRSGELEDYPDFEQARGEANEPHDWTEQDERILQEHWEMEKEWNPDIEGVS